MKLEQIHMEQSYITQDEIKHAISGNIPWIKRDQLFHLTNRKNRHLRREMNRSQSINKLMCSHGDTGFTQFSNLLFNFLYHSDLEIYVTNLEINESQRIKTFPIGLTNHTNETRFHQIFGDANQLKEAYESSADRKNRIISGFSSKTHHSRKLALKHSLSSKFVTNLSYLPTPQGRLNFLTATANSLAVVCPRGNGIDTHRVWESLYLGAVPIVRKGEFPESLFRSMEVPCVELDHWRELNDSNIVERVLSIQWPEEFNKKLTVGYWIGKIKGNTE